jgi:hypothetical protein
MRFGVTATLALLAAVGATGALAAGAAPRDPFSLLLRPADLPRGADVSRGRGPASLEQGLRRSGIRARAAYGGYTYDVRQAGSVTLSGMVVTTGSAADARRTFTLFRTDMAGDGRTVALPRYGAAQLATRSRSSADWLDVLVRQGRVVWSLSLRTNGVTVLGVTRALAELKRYAAAQKRRVGAG